MAYHPFRRLGLKAFSLALAVLLWLSVSGDAVVDRTVRVSLEYQNVPIGLEMVGLPPANVDVRLRGASTLVGRVGSDEIAVVLDLGSARPGRLLFHLLDSDVRAPFGIDIMSVAPATIPLEFERSGRRSVLVEPVIAGQPAPGFVVSRWRSVPARVEVEGPESQLARTSVATTDVVSIENIRATLRQEVNIGVVDAAIRLKQPRRATVTVELAPAEEDGLFTDVPIAIRSESAGRVEMGTKTATVHVKGLDGVIKALSRERLQVWVDVANLPPGWHTVPVRFEGEAGYGIVQVDPSVIELRIK